MLPRPSRRRFSWSCSYSGAAIASSAHMVGVDLQRALFDLRQIQRAGPWCWLGWWQAGRPSARLTNGADMVGAHQGHLFEGGVDGCVAPLVEQLANLVQVVGGVAAQPLDAALDEPFVLGERAQERLPLIGKVAGVAGPVEAFLVLGQVGDAPPPLEQLVTGDLLVPGDDRALVADLLAVHQLAGVDRRHLVEVVLPAHPEVQVDPSLELRSVDERGLRQRTQAGTLALEPIYGPLVHGAVLAHVADRLQPPAAVLLGLLQRRRSLPGQTVLLHVLDACLDLALGLPAPLTGRDRLEAPAFGEGEEGRVEHDLVTGVPQHRRLQVVDHDRGRHPAGGAKGALQGREQHRLRLADGELQIAPPRIPEDVDESAQPPASSLVLDVVPALQAARLRLLPRPGLEAGHQFQRRFTAQLPAQHLHPLIATVIAAALKLAEEYAGIQVRVLLQALADVVPVGIQLAPPLSAQRSGRRVALPLRHRLSVQAQTAGNAGHRYPLLTQDLDLAPLLHRDHLGCLQLRRRRSRSGG